MNKLKFLTRGLVVNGAAVLAALLIAGGLLFVTGSFSENALQAKTQAESALSQDNAQLAMLRSQLEQSGQAEKRFVEIQLNRTNTTFTSDTEALREWARGVKSRYRFADNFRMNLPPEIPSDKPELANLDYAVGVRSGVTIELEAISDLHVYSFLDDMRKSAPGLARVSFFELERKSDMEGQTYRELLAGGAPSLVTGRVQFTWVGLNPKPKGDAAATAAPGAAPMPGMGMPQPGGMR